MKSLRGFICEKTLNYRLILAGSISPSPGWLEPPPDTVGSSISNTEVQRRYTTVQFGLRVGDFG